MLLWADKQKTAATCDRAVRVLKAVGEFGPALGARAYIEAERSQKLSAEILQLYERAIVLHHIPSLRRSVFSV